MFIAFEIKLCQVPGISIAIETCDFETVLLLYSAPAKIFSDV